jgi:hypothetical protein
VGGGLNNSVFGLAFDNTGNLVAGGAFFGDTAGGGGSALHYVARWNGANWSDVAAGTDNIVFTLLNNSSILYIAGSFTAAGVTAVNNIAKCDNPATATGWSALGAGIGTAGTDRVNALAIDQAGILYAGGGLSTGVGVIARWNGTAWSALGSGTIDDWIHAIACDNAGNIYVGGDFTTIGGVPCVCIAKWGKK